METLQLILNANKFLLISATVLFLIFYAPRLFCWFAPFKKAKTLTQNKQNRLALIIPAKNEKDAIGELLASIQRQDYLKQDFDSFVIVSDPNDPTIEMSKNAGAKVVIAQNQTCKGDALDACLKQILKTEPNKYDAYIIVDADCILSDDFLTRMNEALQSGKQIIQAKKVVKNYLYNSKKASSLHSAANGLIWTIIDELGNRSKSDRNITNMTIGTGILLRSDVIKELGGWPYKSTLTEDIELMYDCVLRDYSTFYYPHALIYVEESTSLSVTNKRRTRWLSGVVDSKRLYDDKLDSLDSNRKNRKNRYYTTALSPVFAYIGFLSTLGLFSLIAALPISVFSSSLALQSLINFLLCFGAIYGCFFVLTVFCMLIDGKRIKMSFFKKVLLLFYHPLFYMGYIPIIYKALRGTANKEWQVIERMNFDDDAQSHKNHL